MNSLRDETSKSEKSKQPKVWRISKSTPNGLTKEVCVKEANNGFVITTREFGDVNGKWEDREEIVISKANPLEKENKDDMEDCKAINDMKGFEKSFNLSDYMPRE